jgi:hypothetical protein
VRHLIFLIPLMLLGCNQVDKVTAYFTAAGPSQYVQPCYVEEIIQLNGNSQARATNVPGYQHREVVNDKLRVISHCLPCEKANSAKELLACNGEGK